MEKIELVIKIQKAYYELVLERCKDPVLLNAFKNATQLPKGHGDLKDAEKLKHAFVMWSMAVQGNFTDADIANIIYHSPTIIEADKAESEVDNGNNRV